MHEDPKQHDTCSEKSMMRMDLDGRRGFEAPRPLMEPRPFHTDEKGRPGAMIADGDACPKARPQPFLLEEPRPEKYGKPD